MTKTFYRSIAMCAGLFLVLGGAALFAADAPPAGSETLAPLEIELPDPVFIGTPRDIRPSPYLEPYTGAPRPPFLAPAGATNVALGKRVTASERDPIVGDFDMITDGDKDTSDGSFVEMGPGLQWVQIDLSAEHELYAIVIWRYYAESRVYRDIVVRVSNDPDFVEGVTTLFNNDYDNSSGLGVGKDKEYIEDNQGKLVDAKRTKARYVRLYSNGNTSGDMNHYIEVEVYGKLASK